jgi:hypothetical protein
MCMLCSALVGEHHWSDLDDNAPARRSERRLRRRLLDHILKHYGMGLRHWAGYGYVLMRPGGGTELVGTIAGLWAAAERGSMVRCDPLDEGLIAALSAERAEPC